MANKEPHSGVDEKRQNVISFTQNKERYSSLYGMVVNVIKEFPEIRRGEV